MDYHNYGTKAEISRVIERSLVYHSASFYEKEKKKKKRKRSRGIKDVAKTVLFPLFYFSPQCSIVEQHYE